MKTIENFRIIVRYFKAPIFYMTPHSATISDEKWAYVI